MTELPLPPVHPDCDLTDFRFMPLDVARLRDSDLASNETPDACWAAVLLWAASWHQVPASSIPDDDRWIAKTAGYAQRGRIDRDWARVRDGALRGFIKCNDGRLYHPVVAEKAREAWEAKLDQRWRSECARIKKHNDRHPGANVTKPTFEDWVSQGCAQGNRLFVPRDIQTCPHGVPGETPSKGQGEGQGQGQINTNPSGEGGDPPPPPVPPLPRTSKPPADPEKSALWAGLKSSLVEQQTCPDAKAAGVLLGKAASKYGQDVFLEACRETLKAERVNTHTYLIELCEKAAGRRVSLNKQEAIEQSNRNVAAGWMPPELRAQQTQGAH